MGAAADSPAARVAGRYEVEGELARGGMGVVYRAVDVTTGHLLALKRSLTQQQASADLTRTMLEREYRTLVTLRHPRIIQVYDFGVDELGPYYTMELLDGADLRSKCPLPWREVCAHLRDVASSLALLHSRRLLHCDVSVANIRLTSEGRAKLLDFGALASFGRNSILAGAPPSMSPEVLDGEDLDQRADLYALGATAYYALCGRHAYPANMLGLLRALWARGRPAPPSALIPGIPAELDELVLSLLDLDRMARPASAAEVIDRLGAIAGLPPDQDQHVQRSYLYNAEVVGRDVERKVLARRLEQALAGRGGGVVIEGAPGLGKSYLLEDLSRAARVAGARVITVEARAHANVQVALAREAGVAYTPGQDAAASDSFENCLSRLAESSPLVLAIEDVHEADGDSLAAYAMLAKAVRHQRILLLATLDPGHPSSQSPALRLLRARLSTLELRPFDEKATHAFTLGLFGDVAAVPRLAAYLQDQAAGNPRACSDIIQLLIEQGHIRYAEGTWILPDELPAVARGGELGALVDAAFDSRIARLRPALRALASCLSPNRRVFDFELCRALAAGHPDIDRKSLPQLLGELVREQVLVVYGDTYAFAGSRVREAFYQRLGEAEKQTQHARLGRELAKVVGTDPKRSFEIGLHFLLGGDERQALDYVHRNVEESLAHPDMLVESIPDLWTLLEHQRKRGASDEEVQFIEGELLLTAYYVDPTIYDRFTDRTLPLLHRTLGFALAERLAPFLGRYLSLTVGLLWAWIKSVTHKRYFISGQSFINSLLVFVGACASVSAGACFRLDRGRHPQLLKLLTVASGLGRYNAFRYLYDLFKVGSNLVRGRYAEAQAGLDDQLVRLPRVPFLTEQSKHQYEAGLQFFVGRNQVQRIDSTTLQCAERIDALGAKHDRLLAQFLRRTHHFYRGDLAAAKREEERFDEMAAQFGSRWVPDVMSVLEFVPYHLAGDVLGLKRTLRRVERLAQDSPGLATHREVIRAMYEGHRGRPDLALRIYAELELQLVPFVDAAWALARGHQAECLNTLGRPAEALAVCEAARSHLTPADRPYVFAYQQLEREAALALAALGRIGEAVRLSDALLAECEGYDNPLVRGLLHHDRARIALTAGDRAAFEHHVEASRKLFSAVANPALRTRAKRLLELGRTHGLVARHSKDDEDVVLSSSVHNARANRVLDQIVQTVGARSACLYLILYGKAVLAAQHGEAASASSFHGDVASIARDLGGGEFNDGAIESLLARAPVEVRGHGRLLPLVAPLADGRRQLVGLLALGDCDNTVALRQLDLSVVASVLSEEDETTDVV